MRHELPPRVSMTVLESIMNFEAGQKVMLNPTVLHPNLCENKVKSYEGRRGIVVSVNEERRMIRFYWTDTGSYKTLPAHRLLIVKQHLQE